MTHLSLLRAAAGRVLAVALAAACAGATALRAAEPVRPLMRDFIGIKAQATGSDKYATAKRS